MIEFRQSFVQDSLICGSVLLDDEYVGEFRVTVPQWDVLREHDTDDVVSTMNEAETKLYLKSIDFAESANT